MFFLKRNMVYNESKLILSKSKKKKKKSNLSPGTVLRPPSERAVLND